MCVLLNVGANIYLLARGNAVLEEERAKVLPFCQKPSQWLEAHSGALSEVCDRCPLR